LGECLGDDEAADDGEDERVLSSIVIWGIGPGSSVVLSSPVRVCRREAIPAHSVHVSAIGVEGLSGLSTIWSTAVLLSLG